MGGVRHFPNDKFSRNNFSSANFINVHFPKSNVRPFKAPQEHLGRALWLEWVRGLRIEYRIGQGTACCSYRTDLGSSCLGSCQLGIPLRSCRLGRSLWDNVSVGTSLNQTEQSKDVGSQEIRLYSLFKLQKINFLVFH